MNQAEPISESLLLFGGFLTVSLVVTIAYSIRISGIKGAINELIENLFLWFLLSLGLANFILPPVDADDEVTGAILFVAFGICRIAKHMKAKASKG